jgi:enamine deaminase RidA (YjgF/YER057c/UK114 family)
VQKVISECSIGKVLKQAGASLEHVVDLTVFLTDMKDYAGFNEVSERWVAMNTHFNSCRFTIPFSTLKQVFPVNKDNGFII